MADVDYSLHRKVQEVSGLVVRLSEQVGAVGGQVAAVDANQQLTRTELQELRDEFRAFVQQAQLTANVQRAETRVGVIQDQVDHEFGHHKVVRRTAVGMLQAFDVGLVSEETVRAVSEQLMIQTPRYWLAPALVALAAWSADEPGMCGRAVEEAFRRSAHRTSLFFALVLRRQNRREESVRWLRHYLLAQDPAHLGREFAVILESISQGAFGAAGRELLRDTLDGWRETMLNDDAAQRAQITRWRAELDSLRPAAPQGEYPVLAQVSPQGPQLAGVLSSARVQRVAHDKYRALLGREFTTSDRIEDAVDDILDRLVSEYDNEELPLRRDLAFNHAVIDHGGDLTAARGAVDTDSAAYEETLDYLTVQTTAALSPEAIGTSVATQRLAVAACRDWFRHAHQQFSADYRGAVPQDVQARFGGAYPIAGRTFQLPPWTGSYTQPLPGLEQQLAAHWDTHARTFLASFAYPLARKATPPALVLLGILVIGFGISAGVTLTVMAVTAAVWGLVIHQGLSAARKVEQAAKTVLDQSRRDALHQLRAGSAELTDWYESYRAADAVEPQLRELIDSLGAALDGASPFDGRTVRTEGSHA
ncbi:hypothetical protein [Streptomyces sp. TLI_146]|uniref:hypothetical protein n=1 Tax=Streptomyces sp. TLI_146 TaxID=1938858 RepID=UPI000C6FEE64|nr:hypothetical protein [Streptomyces sp. TLI_146]PKV87555.1 hypothetical protein BX283_5154 [Streptomyces sp. TLI_146]